SIGYEYGRFGSLIAGLFVVFGAIRLARFNVTTGTYEPSVFIGLPIPTAAVVSALWVSAYLYYDFLRNFSLMIVCIQILLAFLMVSNIRYPSFKKIDLKRANVLKVLILLVILFSMLYLYFLESALIVASLYVLYGIIRSFFTLARKFKKD
ncbi:CDP-alcohol phosphatidyltransferase family protein, partial [Campylobacter lari]